MYYEFDTCQFEGGIWTLESERETDRPEEFDLPHMPGLRALPAGDSQENEKSEGGQWPTPFTDWMENKFIAVKSCPFCGDNLERCTFAHDDDEEFTEELYRNYPHTPWGGAPDLAFLWCCPCCAYWQWCDYFENRGMHGSAATSVLAKFQPAVPEGCMAELVQHLRRNGSLWHSLDPKGMERLVTAIFRANYADAEAMHVGKPGDLGIDVVFVEANGNKWLIQTKRRESPDAVEGFETLQKLLGTLVLEGEVRGIVASNASHFSYQARSQAKRASTRGYTIELLDRGKLHRMLGPLLPDRPWRYYLRERQLPEELLKRFLAETTSSRQGQLFQ